MWFAREGDVLWLRADDNTPGWLLNLEAEPRCRVVLDGREVDAVYEPSAAPEADLRRLVELWRAKYGAEWVQDWYVEKGRVPVRLRLQAAEGSDRSERR